MLNQEFFKCNEIVEYKVIKKFYSKKNDVYLIEAKYNDFNIKYFINKCFGADNQKADIENQMLNIMQKVDIHAPTVVYKGKSNLILEYIPGILLLDMYCNEESLSKDNQLSRSSILLINQLCTWLKRFYTEMGNELGYQVILGDPNFRNFILSSEIVGIDFEDVNRGKVEEDIGSLCGFALMYDLPLTQWKYLFVNYLVKKLVGDMRLDEELINCCIKKQIAQLGLRRNLKKNN